MGANAFSSFPLTLAAYAAALPLAAATAVFGLVRPLSVSAVRALCGVPGELLAEGPALSWAARGRTSAWWTLHLGAGALVSGMTLAVPPMAVVLIALPFVSGPRATELGLGWFSTRAEPYVAPALGIGLLAALALCAAGTGALLARTAPVLLGPTAADRLAAAEERAADLAVRNRLARELHDAVGHALSAVTLQAAAARRMVERDPDFVREALAAIEDTTRRTVGELDAVLGLLRDGDPARPDAAPAPTLAADLDGLLARTRAMRHHHHRPPGARSRRGLGSTPGDRLPRGVPDRPGGPEQRPPPRHRPGGPADPRPGRPTTAQTLTDPVNWRSP